MQRLRITLIGIDFEFFVPQSLRPDMPNLPPLPAHLDDPAVREREVSPSSAIGGNYQPFIAQYRERSIAARAQVPHTLNLRYGPRPNNLIDWFPAPTAKPQPTPHSAHQPAHPPTHTPGLLVYFHGGYWQELSKDDSAYLAPAWHAAGYAHAVVGYTLAPAATLPDIVGECAMALHWLMAQAAELGFDASRVVVAGSSAGGYLSAACATAVLPMPLRGIVPVSGLFSPAWLLGTSVNAALGLDTETAQTCDLLQRPAPATQAVVAVGSIETDLFKHQSAAYAQHLRAAARSLLARETVTLIEVPQRNHFDVIFELGDPATPVFAATQKLFT